MKSLFLLLALFANALQGQPPHSSDPAVQQLKKWLAAYDDTNWDVYREFLQTNFAPDAENMLHDRALRNQTGAFDLISIEEETPTKVTALVSEREFDKVGRIVVEVEAAEPHRILKLKARAIDRPPELSLPHLDESELIARLRKRLENAVSADQFSGAQGTTLQMASLGSHCDLALESSTSVARHSHARGLRNVRPLGSGHTGNKTT
jgi:hypothetical protein